MRSITIAGVAGGVGTSTAALVTAARCAIKGLDARIVTEDVEGLCALAGMLASEDRFANLIPPSKPHAHGVGPFMSSAGLTATTPEGAKILAQRYDAMQVVDAGRDLRAADVVCLTNTYMSLRAASKLQFAPQLWVCLTDSQGSLQEREVRDILGANSEFVFVQRAAAVGRAFDAGTVLSRWPAVLAKLGDDIVEHTQEAAPCK